MMRSRLLVLSMIVGVACLTGCASRSANHELYSVEDKQPWQVLVDTLQVRADSLDVTLLEWAIFEATNEHRERLGLSRVDFEPRLHEAARAHSREMVALDYFDHQSPVADRSTVQKRLQLVGIHKGVGGENIAIHPVQKRMDVVFNARRKEERSSRYAWRNLGLPYSYKEFAAELLERWLNSPPHRENILNPYFQFLGVGCALAEYQQLDVIYVTQNFSTVNY